MADFKEDDWIVITKSSKNWSAIGMTPFVGKVVQITRTRHGESTKFKDYGSWEWNYSQGHFRKALPEEIPGYVIGSNYEIY